MSKFFSSKPKRIIITALLTLVMIFSLTTATVVYSTTSADYTVQNDVTISNTEYRTVYTSKSSYANKFKFYIKHDGTFMFERSGLTPGAEVSFLMTDGEIDNNLNSTNIAYIDQKTVPTNGIVTFSFKLNPRFSYKDNMWIGSNTSYGDMNTLIKFGGIATDNLYISPDMDNNILRIGSDLYSLSSKEINDTNTVLDSIRDGGNVLFYNFNGRWYDLMDDKATSNAYLVPNNAEDREETDAWDLRYYYLPMDMATSLNGGQSYIEID